MSKINKGRVLLGGLVAGLVLNILDCLVDWLIIVDGWAEAMAYLDLQPPESLLIAASIVIDFLIGFFIVWLYAAIRPRYGAGPKTAVLAGLAVWFICWLIGWGSTAFIVYPCELVRIVIVAGLAECVLAALAGSWVYKEEEIG